MRLRNWFDKADHLTAVHKGNPVLSHPDVIAEDEKQWEEEHQEEERGKKAHQALNELFASIDEEEEDEEVEE